MKIGMRLHGGLPAARCVELAQLAEASGLQSLWFAENPFARGVWPAMVASLLATRTVTIGAGVFNPFNRHPTLIAMEIAAFDELAQGRAAIGIGAGVVDRVTRMGLSNAKPIAALRDCVTIVRGLLRGETVTHDGAVFSAKAVRLDYPVFRPDMPIHLAAKGDQSLRLAGQLADGVMLSNMSPPGFTRRAAGLIAEGAAKAGRPAPASVVQYLPCVLRDDAAEARRIVRATLHEALTTHWGAAPGLMREAMVQESGIDEADFAAAVTADASGLDDRFVDAFSIAGDAAAFHAGVERFAAAGVTELAVTLAGPEPERTAAILASALSRR